MTKTLCDLEAITYFPLFGDSSNTQPYQYLPLHKKLYLNCRKCYLVK